MRLLYIANIRLPTEKAHGLQIMQNCEAFAQAGAEVTLWVARRRNTPAMQAVTDPWSYYGVAPCFSVRRVPCLDLLPLVPGRTDGVARFIFYLQLGTFLLVAWLWALFAWAEVYYSRDALVLLVLSLVKPRRALAYEVHSLAASAGGRWVQRQAIRRVGSVIAVTERLREAMIALGAQPARVLVAHDGVRRERFVELPSVAQARAALGWPPQAFIVGYAGRLQTMTMDKGVGLLIEALSEVDGAVLALVGGPDEEAVALRQRWLDRGLDAARFLYAGHVPPDDVPLYLSAFDVCVLPFPWTEHFAYYASPVKLFEYMAARRAIVASDLPALAEVVTDGESALLVPPGDVEALRAALVRLRDDPMLRRRLADCAYERAQAYTWDARARAILAHLTSA